MKNELKPYIKSFLAGKDWTAAGLIEDFIRAEHPNHRKGDTTSRVLRFMKEDGTVESQNFNKRGEKVKKGNVYYRLKTLPAESAPPKIPSFNGIPIYKPLAPVQGKLI